VLNDKIENRSKKIFSLTKKYFDYDNLDAMSEALDVPKSTLHRHISAEMTRIPDWPEITKARNERGELGPVFGADLTYVSIGRKETPYFHGTEFVSNFHIAYELCRNKNAATITAILLKLRSCGYYPKVIVTDLAPELLTSYTQVYPESVIQGCIFHLSKWLNEELRTRAKKFDEESIVDLNAEVRALIRPTKKAKNVEIKEQKKNNKTELYNKVKAIIREIANSENKVTQQSKVDELNALKLDDTTAQIVRSKFLKNLKYYHALDEKIFCAYGRAIQTNNRLEGVMSQIKALETKFRGFKTYESTKNVLKSYWYLRNIASNPFPLTNELTKMPGRVVLRYNMPVSFYSNDWTDLKKMSKKNRLPLEILKKEAQRFGMKIADRYAYAGDFAQECGLELSIMMNNLLNQFRQRRGWITSPTDDLKNKLYYGITVTLLQNSGIKINKTKFYPSKNAATIYQNKKEIANSIAIKKTAGFYEIDGLLVHKSDALAIIKNETTNAANRLIESSGLNKDPVSSIPWLPPQALLWNGSVENGFKVQETCYSSVALAMLLTKIGSHNVQFFQKIENYENNPLGVKSDEGKGVIPPILIGRNETNSEKKEAAEIRAKILTVETKQNDYINNNTFLHNFSFLKAECAKHQHEKQFSYPSSP
jgi:hypothetical protein